MSMPTPRQLREQAAQWLSQGISPRRLAWTLAVGFAVGCIPVVGIPTVLCAGLALALRLNLPAIQAANYLAMPFQIALILPFIRLGGWLCSAPAQPGVLNVRQLLHSSPMATVSTFGAAAGHALLGWLLIATPTVLVTSPVLARLLGRIPALQQTGA